MELCITVILKEERGFDCAFQLMYQPNPIWTQNEEWLQGDNTHIGFEMNGRFKELLEHCKRLNHILSDEKECVVLIRKEIIFNPDLHIKELVGDIEDNGYTVRVMTY